MMPEDPQVFAAEGQEPPPLIVEHLVPESPPLRATLPVRE